ncbi:MAG: phage portal protein [Rhodospirillaceae bacterium]|nr:phage portal protein [Rhodospirillaceae bacterium]
MRWPWQRAPVERRQSDGAYAQAVLNAIEAEAAGTAADTSSTAAVEAAAGALSRAMAAATVEGPEWAAETVTGDFLAQVGRDLIRSGESLHAVRMGGDGMVRLIPCASWHWEGSHDPAGWTVRATAYGPSTSTTWNLPAGSVVFCRWGGDAGSPYLGRSPLRYAATTLKLSGQVERSLADEAAGPLAQLLAVPGDGGPVGSGDDDDDPLAQLRADITAARGRAAFLETTAGGHGEGRQAAPRRDWEASRLGPDPPDAMATIRKDVFEHVLSACGMPPSLFDDSDGTAQRESLRRWHMGTVRPLAGILESELRRKVDSRIRLRFDSYALDMVSRAQVVQKLVMAGVEPAVAMGAVGLMDDD